MEAGEENGGNASMKRQREPLSDTEENIFSAPEANDGQKRRRLEASGLENRSPKPSSSGRLAELEAKPDTPIVMSVRSRVQQLTQRREGGAPPTQRCLSDPGSDGPSVSIHSKGFREHLLGEGEFSQRMERFKPLLPTSPAPSLSPANTCLRTRSDFVSEIQQKLQGTTTPSSKQTSRIRQVSGDTEMKDGSFIEASASGAEKPSVNTTDAELSSHDDTNTGDIIDQMFEEVLEYADMMEERRDAAEERDSGISACSVDKDKVDTESEKEKSEEEEGEAKKAENTGDELLTFPTSGILSPLSKSVEAVVTPLRLAATQESNPPSLLLTPEETSTPPAEAAPLYSIDAYRTQRRSKLPTIQSVTPGVQRRAPEASSSQPSVNTKEKIAAHNEEAAKLQTVINQTLQALSCCTDEDHGRGSLEEAEAEKLLLVSCEKRSALLAEVARLREERSSESGEASGEDKDYVSQQPCRGTVSITNIQLPLKVEFVCSSHGRAGRPSHYFLVLIRYGPCSIVATPLATAADAQNGDTISFPTSVTLKDIRSSFEIDVEVYSLSHTSSSSCSVDRTATKSRVSRRCLSQIVFIVIYGTLLSPVQDFRGLLDPPVHLV
uniref:Actin-binding protein anillin-like n=1 Tax=Stegastes partitus TaxID=144197 RepID=A0A3B5AQS5_9TELE